MDDAESILRRHHRRHRDSLTGVAMFGIGGGGEMEFFGPSKIRSDRQNGELARLWDQSSCINSAARIAHRFSCSVYFGWVLREGDERPLVYAFPVDGGVALDGGSTFYGRALGVIGYNVGPDDLRLLTRRLNLREGLTAVASAHGRFPAIDSPPRLLRPPHMPGEGATSLAAAEADTDAPPSRLSGGCREVPPSLPAPAAGTNS